MEFLLQLVYLVSALLFIWGLKEMGSPVTARRGILRAGVGMVAAVLITFVWVPGGNFLLMSTALLVGGVIAWVSGRVVQMTAMPQMVALYNGMGGGSAACIAALELLQPVAAHGTVALVLAVLGGWIGAVSFSGSLIAFAKLQGWLQRSWVFSGQQRLNLIVVAVTAGLGLLLLVVPEHAAFPLLLFFLLALAYGILMTLPIGGADMPVVISLYNAFTGLAVAFEGFVLDNAAMIVAGTVVGAAGSMLTQLMAKAMNRSLANVLFSAFGTDVQQAAGGEGGEWKEAGANDVAAMMAYANGVIVIPGYGMAVAQAQHKLWELCGLLEQQGVPVRFAIHPVAGRMPGHMNVLLAEAGVPYDRIYDLQDINADFPNTDVALVIGANDVVNPDARSNRASPIYGMPILDADRAGNCIVIKRGRGRGFSGVDNSLFHAAPVPPGPGPGRRPARRRAGCVPAPVRPGLPAPAPPGGGSIPAGRSGRHGRSGHGHSAGRGRGRAGGDGPGRWHVPARASARRGFAGSCRGGNRA